MGRSRGTTASRRCSTPLARRASRTRSMLSSRRRQWQLHQLILQQRAPKVLLSKLLDLCKHALYEEEKNQNLNGTPETRDEESKNDYYASQSTTILWIGKKNKFVQEPKKKFFEKKKKKKKKKKKS